jgi:RNA polymerase sigma factor (sigma-70 family)
MEADPVGGLQAAVRSLAAATSAPARTAALRAALDHLDAVQRQLVDLRDETIVALNADGWSLQQIAAELGITRGRVHQILQSRRAEGAPGPARRRTGPR